MKIQLTTVVEIPDDQLFVDIPHDELPPGALEGQAKQIVWDGMCHFLIRHRLLLSMESFGRNDERMSMFHSAWAKVCEELHWDMTVVP